jgi:hypothetical protein
MDEEIGSFAFLRGVERCRGGRPVFILVVTVAVSGITERGSRRRSPWNRNEIPIRIKVSRGLIE